MSKTTMCKYPIVSSAWEPMLLQNGDLLFNNIYGKHSKISNPPKDLYNIVNLCNGDRTVEDIKYALSRQDIEIKIEDLERALEILINAGIITENIRKDLPLWLPEEEYERYHTLIAWLEKFETNGTLAMDSFKLLRESNICVIGLGGTGSLISMMLVATGVKNITLIDGDVIELSNFVRQIFYSPNEIGLYKVDVMKKKLLEFGHELNIKTVSSYINDYKDADNIINNDFDFVFLEADAPRILVNRWINEVCTKKKIPYIYSFSGQVGPIYIPGESPCFNCLEEHIRSEIGSEHDNVVEALQKYRTRKYPSFVSGVTLNSHFQFSDAIGYITKAYKPLTMNNIVRLNGTVDMPISTEKITRNPNCNYCI
jgi:molybdopterin-synthase adenylyltransferase